MRHFISEAWLETAQLLKWVGVALILSLVFFSINNISGCSGTQAIPAREVVK